MHLASSSAKKVFAPVSSFTSQLKIQEMENANPVVYASALARAVCPEDELDDVHDDIDSREIFGEVTSSASELAGMYRITSMWEEAAFYCSGMQVLRWMWWLP